MSKEIEAGYQHDKVIARLPGGTDPRLAARVAMSAFMEKTDGTTDMPWWLEPGIRWWHAGPMGLKHGDEVLPPSITGAVPLIESDPTMVYVTTDRAEAVIYATFQIGRSSRFAVLYEVSFAEEPISDDTQPESQTSFRVPRATVRRIEAPSKAELTGAMMEIMGPDPMHDDDPKGDNPFTDNEPIEAQCDLENPGSCEACD